MNSASGTSTNAAAGQNATLQGYTDQGNAFFALTNSTGPQLGTVAAAGNTTYNFAPNQTLSSTFTQSGPFSITQVFTIRLTAGTNANLTLSTSTSAPTAVPEPTTLALVLAGVPLLAYRALRRARA